jgi:hypothetical protein
VKQRTIVYCRALWPECQIDARLGVPPTV